MADTGQFQLVAMGRVAGANFDSILQARRDLFAAKVPGSDAAGDLLVLLHDLDGRGRTCAE